MAFLIGGANSLTGGYEISNSLRFNDDDNANLTLNPGTSSDNKTCTLSWWAKLGVATGNGTDYHFSNHTDANNRLRAHISNTGEFALFGKLSGSTFVDIYTNAQYKDPSAWYHFMVILDSTDGTAADRTQLWINGLRNTDVTLGTSPASNDDMIWGSRDNMTIGAGHSGSAANANPYDGYFAEMHFIDGQKKASTDFGEFNDNGVWIPKEYSGTYGTNGWFMEFKQTGTSQNSSGIGADTSGNDNHFAVTNSVAADVTTDTPTNNFCTGNPLDVSGVDNPGDVCTFSEGNTKIVQAGSNNVVGWKASTIGIRNGKWYFELKLPIIDYQVFGVGASTWDGQDGAADNQFSVYIDNGTETFRRGAGVAAAALSVTSSNNDIWMFALDLDSPKLWIGHQGTWLASGDPAAGSNPMSTQAITDTIFIGGSLYTQNDSQILLNTGNPPYANSSSQADDNGYGDFEYDVPAGFYSICTKNLAEFG